MKILDKKRYPAVLSSAGLTIFSLAWMLVLSGCCLMHPHGTADRDDTLIDLNTWLARGNWDQGQSFEFPKTTDILLSNGLRIMVVEKHDVPMVYARAQIRGGSIYDPPEKSGLAYLTGWVLTEGTENFPDAEIDAVMDAHGAYVTSVAYNESCIATLTCLSGDMARLFPYYAEILSKPAFDERVIENNRNHLIGSLMRSMDDTGEVCSRVFRDAVFRGHPYQNPMTGTIGGLQSITRSDVQDFYARYYRPDRAALVIVGDVTAEDIRNLCEQHLADWKPAREPLPVIGPPSPVEGLQILLVDYPSATQAQIMMGHVGINRTNPDRFRITVMNKILGGGGLYTRLAEEVRVKRGLTYSIYCYFARREYTGEFMLSTFTKAESAAETIRVCLDEIRRIRTESVTEKELEDAKMTLIGGHPLQFEEYEDIAQTLVHNSFYGLPITDVTHFADAVSAITVSDVCLVARKYLSADDIVIVVVGPADQLRESLESIGPVQIVEPL